MASVQAALTDRTPSGLRYDDVERSAGYREQDSSSTSRHRRDGSFAAGRCARLRT